MSESEFSFLSLEWKNIRNWLICIAFLNTKFCKSGKKQDISSEKKHA